MSGVLPFAAMLLAFALGVSAHVAIVFGLATRAPRWRALAAFALPPAGVFWAVRERMRVRAALFVVAWLGYIAARALQR